MNTNKIKVALIGAGQRGKDVYGTYALDNPSLLEYVAVAEPNLIKREQFAKLHNLRPDQCFESWEALLQQPKCADAVIIATPDAVHYAPSKRALDLGYHVLLEKPMSNSALECLKLGQLAREKKLTFMICHVLRYTPFFKTIHDLIQNGAIGDVVTVQHNENIGYYHMAHSFVRGNWRNTAESSPIILAKSCHDMDILHYLIGSNCTSLSSFGSLQYFNASNAPAKASTRCLTCAVASTCLYSAKKQYLSALGRWPSTVVSEIQTEEAILNALATGPYGRCVYACDNDVCDHQVTIMGFKNGVTATFNLSAFTNKVHRTLKIMGTRGEIRADDSKNTVEVQRFGEPMPTVYTPSVISGGHGGGDHALMYDFVNQVRSDASTTSALTAADKSVHSHIMAFAAETSRITGKTIDLGEYIDAFDYTVFKNVKS